MSPGVRGIYIDHGVRKDRGDFTRPILRAAGQTVVGSLQCALDIVRFTCDGDHNSGSPLVRERRTSHHKNARA